MIKLDNVFKLSWIIGLIITGSTFADDFKNLPQMDSQSSVKLSPKMRVQPVGSAKYTIETANMIEYLDNILIFDTQDAYQSQPRILAFAAANTGYGAPGDLAYVGGFLFVEEKGSAYTLLKAGKVYKDPDTDELLGMQAIAIGSAELQTDGDPMTIKILNVTEQIEVGARVIPRTGLDLPAVIEARVPLKKFSGYVLSVKNPSTGDGRYSPIVLNLGARNGIAVGDLLNLREPPKKVIDKQEDKTSEVEATTFGEVMVYKVMEKVCLGFILKTTRPVVANDLVSTSS